VRGELRGLVSDLSVVLAGDGCFPTLESQATRLAASKMPRLRRVSGREKVVSKWGLTRSHRLKMSKMSKVSKMSRLAGDGCFPTLESQATRLADSKMPRLRRVSGREKVVSRSGLTGAHRLKMSKMSKMSRSRAAVGWALLPVDRRLESQRRRSILADSGR